MEVAADQLEQEADARALAAEARATAARDEAPFNLLAVLGPMRAPIDAAIAW